MVIQAASYYALLKETWRGWNQHNALRLGASLAYYTIFSIAPLFLITLAIAGYWFGEEAARRELFAQLNGLVGQESGRAIEALVANANQPKAGRWAAAVAIVTLFIGATGVFVQLKDALNTIWEVRQKPGSGIRQFIIARLLSFALILAIGFLLLVSLIISAGLAAIGKFLSALLPADVTIWLVINFLFTFGLITCLFALILKYLPDVQIGWKDVWLGAVFAAILFNLGKLALGIYLTHSAITSAYGAAGSLVVILVWVYYSSQTVFLGAEFTRATTQKRGRKLATVRGAEFITVKTESKGELNAPGTAG